MKPDQATRELAACLERLRWTISGYRAGGFLDWKHTHRELPEEALTESCLSQSAGPAESVDNGLPDIGSRLSEIARNLDGCSRCRLHSGRKNLVFGEGSARSGIVFVGEGPGFEEDQQARPFVGRAGKLLERMIQAIGFERDEVYICNVVKCRPPENRTPQSDEIESCSPFLLAQIEALRPKVICALGACAAQTLVGKTTYISQLRSKVHLWRGIPLVCTYHPAYLLRTPSQKAATWQDLKEVLKILGA
jgi:DNA polymerase